MEGGVVCFRFRLEPHGAGSHGEERGSHTSGQALHSGVATLVWSLCHREPDVIIVHPHPGMLMEKVVESLNHITVGRL